MALYKNAGPVEGPAFGEESLSSLSPRHACIRLRLREHLIGSHVRWSRRLNLGSVRCFPPLLCRCNSPDKRQRIGNRLHTFPVRSRRAAGRACRETVPETLLLSEGRGRRDNSRRWWAETSPSG